MTSIDELQKALEEVTNILEDYSAPNQVWAKVRILEGLFSAFQERSLSAPSKEPSLRKRGEVWLGACQQSRKGSKGCFVTTHNEEWFCEDCKKIFDETLTWKVSGVEEK